MAIKINNSTIIDDSRNIVNAGIVTATSFSGDGSGLTGVGVGASDSVNTTGIITASSFVGNLTGTATGLTGSPDVTVGVLTATTISAGNTTGTSGQVLQSTGTGVTWTTASGGISLTDSNVIGYNSAGVRNDGANGRLEVFGTGNFRVFTSPGTYVVNPGISSIRVRVVGAGGNGGTGAGPSAPISAGGGGGGGYAHKVITSFSAPRTYTVTVGSAPGGTSSFGSEVSATGGSNGSPSGPGGSGGTGSSGDVNYTGATGGGAAAPYSGGPGGAAATQLGNGSGGSVPGIPNKPEEKIYVNRFPFDIFDGRTALSSPYFFYGGPGIYTEFLNAGVNGGVGAISGNVALPPGNATTPFSGGRGGIGAGGGGGGPIPGSTVPGGPGGIGGGGGGGNRINFAPGGSGGPGIVIVEW